ncbi:MAG TPA: hypothetical protein VFF40_13230 [Acidimicrobiia bacterium]|nr:hypothetical protein [Acidimicrobiia bacterium]
MVGIGSKAGALLSAGLAVALLGGLAGCSSDDAASVDVTLSEWIVEPDPTSADSGEVEFVGDNKGSETHELVVVAAESAEALPTDADGAVVEEELPEGALIGEIEDIEAGSSKTVKLDLEAGSYVIFCNITDEEPDGTIESHFAEGMHTSFDIP